MSPPLPVVTPKQLVRAIKKAGFNPHHQSGSHLFLYSVRLPVTIVCIPLHDGDLKRGTLKAILRQAGLSVADLIDLLK
jgi:predicted RNA binding protein YcfA (HicA-like mRNA interferase family)